MAHSMLRENMPGGARSWSSVVGTTRADPPQSEARSEQVRGIKRATRRLKLSPLVICSMLIVLVAVTAAVLADVIAPLRNEQLTFLSKLKPPFWMQGADGVLSVIGWATFTRVSRGEVRALKSREFVQAAEAVGVPAVRIALRHVLPNILSSITVLWTFTVATVIIAEASLSFLGLGLPQPSVSWGAMINDARNYLDTAWWVPFWPSLTLTLVVVAINTLGDWLRDVLDPTMRR